MVYCSSTNTGTYTSLLTSTTPYKLTQVDLYYNSIGDFLSESKKLTFLLDDYNNVEFEILRDNSNKKNQEVTRDISSPEFDYNAEY